MNEREIAREKRKQGRLERFGTNTPRCPCCGETDPRVFEAHHVAGRRFDAQTIWICANCHRKLTDDQKDHPGPLGGTGDLGERVCHLLLGLADMLRLVAEKLVAFAEALLEQSRATSTAAKGAR